jgi:hypothetical protein
MLLDLHRDFIIDAWDTVACGTCVARAGRAVAVLPDPIIPSTRISRAASTNPGYGAAWSLRSLVKDEVHPAFVRVDDFARAGSSWC